MSAPGAGSDLAGTDLKDSHPQIVQNPEVKTAVTVVQATRTPIGKSDFPGYTPRKGDHTACVPGSFAVCQIEGTRYKTGVSKKNTKRDNNQQDAYQFAALDEKSFPENYCLAKDLNLAVWQHVAGGLASEREGGCAAILAIFHKNKLYISHAGDCRALLIFRDRTTGEIVHFTLLMMRFHNVSEVGEQLRYTNGEIFLGRDNIQRLGGRLMVTRGLGDAGVEISSVPDFLVCDLTRVKDQYDMDLLMTTDGVVDRLTYNQILNVLARCDANDLPAQVKALVNAGLIAKSPDNQTAVIQRLIKPGILALGDGHGQKGSTTANTAVTWFPESLNQYLTTANIYNRAPNDEESKYDARKEQLYKNIRLDGQVYILHNRGPLIRNSAIITEELKKFFFETGKYAFDCSSTEILMQKHADYCQVKEIWYCNINHWSKSQKNYRQRFSAHLEIDFIYKANNLISVQVILSLPPEQKEFHGLKRIGFLSKTTNFYNKDQTFLVRNVGTTNQPATNAWTGHLNTEQIAEVIAAVSTKLLEAKDDRTAQQYLETIWNETPQFFWNFYSQIFKYTGWMTEYFTPGSERIHKQLIEYQNACFTIDREQKLSRLYAILETIHLMAYDQACCWSSNSQHRNYQEAISGVVSLVNKEISFLLNFQPGLPKNNFIPTLINTPAKKPVEFPTWIQHNRGKIACCFVTSVATAIGLPLWLAGSAAGAGGGGAGTAVAVGLGTAGINEGVKKHFETRTQRFLNYSQPVMENSQQPEPGANGPEERKAEQQPTLVLSPVKRDQFIQAKKPTPTIITQYIKAIEQKDDGLKQTILQNKQLIFGALEQLFGSNNLAEKGAFLHLIKDDTFCDFIVNNISKFSRILNSSKYKDEYKSLIKDLNSHVYGMMEELTTNPQESVPGLVLALGS